MGKDTWARWTPREGGGGLRRSGGKLGGRRRSIPRLSHAHTLARRMQKEALPRNIRKASVKMRRSATREMLRWPHSPSRIKNRARFVSSNSRAATASAGLAIAGMSFTRGAYRSGWIVMIRVPCAGGISSRPKRRYSSEKRVRRPPVRGFLQETRSIQIFGYFYFDRGPIKLIQSSEVDHGR